jgi:hypothetical protein
MSFDERLSNNYEEARASLLSFQLQALTLVRTTMSIKKSSLGSTIKTVLGDEIVWVSGSLRVMIKFKELTMLIVCM